jgi:hypothetical protein
LLRTFPVVEQMHLAPQQWIMHKKLFFSYLGFDEQELQLIVPAKMRILKFHCFKYNAACFITDEAGGCKI